MNCDRFKHQELSHGATPLDVVVVRFLLDLG